MQHYALIGSSLTHSLSKQYFETIHDCTQCDYSLIEMAQIAEIRSLAHSRQLSGFNVTIPYKQAILPYLDTLDTTSQTIGAVNVVNVVHSHDSRTPIMLEGYNTDAPAFIETLRSYCQQKRCPLPPTALILGTGGAALAVAWALCQAGCRYHLVSRTPTAARQRLLQQSTPYFRPADHIINYDQAYAEAAMHQLIVNATPTGTTPQSDATPWQYPQYLTPYHLCYDLIYNPSETRFLRDARHAGADTHNGLTMLQHQARLSYNIWGIGNSHRHSYITKEN